jgi:hypothetical protein
MVLQAQPSLTDFLDAPYADVCSVAPLAMVYAAAGTRRSAALAGLGSHSEEYVSSSRRQMMEACALIFAHGVRHTFTVLASPGQFSEVGRYRARLVDWILWGVNGPEAIQDFARRGWRVRLLTDPSIPELDALQRKLAAAQSASAVDVASGGKTLWFLVVPDADAPWRWALDAIHRSGARTQAEAIRALYGEDIPLISLFLGFGKPVIAPELLPPLLGGAVNCYWSQRPGYQLAEAEFRRILYDHAFVRSTWQADKSGRGEEALATRAAWEAGPVLGLGMRLGPFWYPQPFALPPGIAVNAELGGQSTG